MSKRTTKRSKRVLEQRQRDFDRLDYATKAERCRPGSLNRKKNYGGRRKK